MTQDFPLRVLVVDDERLIRWSIAETLKEHGHTVLEAEDGAAALGATQVSSQGIDAVALDYRLPDTNNLSLLAQIRRMSPGIPVVLMTAFGSSEVIEDARRLGAYHVMDTPFELRDLEAVVSRACEGR